MGTRENFQMRFLQLKIAPPYGSLSAETEQIAASGNFE